MFSQVDLQTVHVFQSLLQKFAQALGPRNHRAARGSRAGCLPGAPEPERVPWRMGGTEADSTENLLVLNVGNGGMR